MISEKIVVIDDDPRVIRAIRLRLTEYELVEFNQGEEAIDYLQKPNEINLVLLDVRMSGMDGLSVLSEIRKIKKDIGVILMTAYSTKDILIQALRNHADDFIEKPFEAEELREKIRLILKKKLFSHNLRRNNNTQVDRIKRFVERNYNNATLEFIAEEMCLSPKYVSRFFNQKAKYGFRKYKLQIRMNRAKHLLEKTCLNVNEIAVELGYQNPESFMRIFKRLVELTPSEYRKKHTKLKANL